jgi:hypothetical protein
MRRGEDRPRESGERELRRAARASGPASWPAWLCLAAIAAASLAAIWTVDYIPTHDGPQYVFVLHARNRLADPATGWGTYFQPGHPTTNLGFAFLYGPLDRLFPWRTALKLTVSAMALLWMAGAVAFARSLHRDRLWLGVALASVAFQWPFYMGFFAFQVAMLLGLLILALGFSLESWRLVHRALLALLLFLQALCHVLPAVVTGLVLAALALSRGGSRAWKREVAWAAAMGLPAAAVVATLLATGMTALAAMNRPNLENFTYEWPAFWSLAKCFAAGPAWRAWPLTLLALSAPALAWRLQGGTTSAEDRALLASGGLLFLAAVALPLHLRTWDFFSVRFVPMAVCVWLAAIPLERLRAGRWRLSVLGLLALYGIAAGLWPVGFHHTLERVTADAHSGLRAELSRDGPRLPIVLDSLHWRDLDDPGIPVPYFVPLNNLGQLYAVAHGGVVPFNFSVNPRLHLLLYSQHFDREYPAIPDPERTWPVELAKPANQHNSSLRAALTTHAASFGGAFQDIIFFGRPEETELLIRRGYVPEFRRGGLLIARFEGCPLSLDLPARLLAEPGGQVELGWQPLTDPVTRFSLEGARPLGDGRARLALEDAPCGAVWLRLRSRPDDPRDPASGIHLCEGSDRSGKLVVTATQATPLVSCALP